VLIFSLPENIIYFPLVILPERVEDGDINPDFPSIS
jgi:hypothetical protein